jgi:hypothetical protein
MKRTLMAALASASLIALAQSALAAELQLKRVMLSSGGVGYFEYETKVTGNETVEVPVRLDQMDDVLKSLVVFDDKGGGGTLETQGRDSLTEIFRTMPVGPDAFSSPANLMAALQGEIVTVEDPVSATGRIVSVVTETTETESGATFEQNRVTLMTTSGLVSFILEEARGVRFTNESLNAKVNDALAAIAANRQREGRTLRVKAAGEGERTLTIGYVVEAPLWKTSYRLVTDGDGKARMQGWAILENASGAAWENVELTLVSGNPVTFRQALYNTYYVERPEIPVEVLGRVLPQTDTGDMERARAESNGAGVPYDAVPAAAPPPPPPPAPAIAPSPEEEQVVVTGAKIPGQAGAQAAQSSEAATQVVFTLKDAVTAGSGQTLAVPMIDREVPAEEVALFQPDTHPRHPLMSVNLTNDTESGMPPGIVTLYDTRGGKTVYVGDASMGTLPTGESRMLSFALDQKTVVDQTSKSESNLVSAKIAGGLIETQTKTRMEFLYTLKAPASEARKVILESPRYTEWTLIEPPSDGVRVTESAVRVPVDLATGETKAQNIVWEKIDTSSYALVELDDYSIGVFIENAQISEAQREAFRKLRDLRGALTDADRKLSENEARRNQIVAEQARIRENLAAVPEGSDLQRRYLAQLASQEDEIARLAAEAETLRATREAARKALGDYATSLTL